MASRTGLLGSASLIVKTAAVPTSGSLLVERSSQTSARGEFDGVAGLDAYRLVAKDWVGTPGRQLQFEFRYMQA